MDDSRNLPLWLAKDLAAWASTDLPPFPYRRTHPHVARARNVLAAVCAEHDISSWKDIKPSMVQAYMRKRSHLKPETLSSYLKSVRRWLCWHERDDPAAPQLSTRLSNLAPRGSHDDPNVLTVEQMNKLLERAEWVYKGSTSLRYLDGKGRERRPIMGDWPKGSFPLFVRFGLFMGLRPWEAGLMKWTELHLDEPTPYVKLTAHELRGLKTSLSGTKLIVPPEVLVPLLQFRESAPEKPYLFAAPCRKSANGWRPANYDQIWRALRQEFGLPSLNARTLRRTFATLLSRRTRNIFEVAAATRHIRIQTLQHYVELAGGQLIDPFSGQRVLT